MRWSSWAALVAGIAAGALLAWGLEALQRQRLAALEAQLAVVDQRLRELAAVRVPVDAFQADRSRLAAQLGRIDELRSRRRCPAELLSSLLLERGGAALSGLALEGTMLAAVGRAGSAADVEALTSRIAGSAWAQSVRVATAPDGGRGDGVRFGLLASVEQPPCEGARQP